MERAAAGGGQFELTDDDAPIVAAVCRKLDGIALAVELAASHVSALGLSGLAEFLDSRLEFLWRARRTGQPRHRTLEALLDWSYDLLSEAEQSVLRMLSVFVGPFTLEAAQAIVSDTQPRAAETVSMVANLVHKSLLSAATQDSPARYHLLENTRAYASAKLSWSGEANATASRHARYLTDLFRSGECPSFDRMDTRNLGNVRAAVEWSFSADGDSELGIDLILAVTPVLLRLSCLGECRRWSERAIAALREDARGTVRELDLLESLAISRMFTCGNDDEVRAAIRRGLELARALGNKQREFDFLAGLDIFLTRIGDFQGALQVAKDSDVLVRTTMDRGRAPVADWMLGVAHHLIGNQALAQMHCEAGIAQDTAPRLRHRDVFGYSHRIRALVALSRTLWLRGLPQQAARVAREAIDEAETFNQPVTICLSFIYTAPVYLWSGDVAAADRVITQLIAKASQHSLKPYHAVGLGLLGELKLACGELDAGVTLLLDAIETLDAGQQFLQVPEFATCLAQGLAAKGQHERALATIEEAIAQRARSGASFDMPELLRVKGQILLSASESGYSLGRQQLNRSLDLAETQHSLSWALRAAMTELRSASQKPQARATLAQIYARFTEGFDTHDLQAARRLLDSSSSD